MAGTNAETFREVIDAFNRRDLEAFVALSDEEIVAESRLAAIEGGYRGHHGLRRWWANLLEMLPDYRLGPEDVQEHPGELLVGRVRAHASGASSSAPVLERIWIVTQFRAGRCIWWRICLSEEEASAAVTERSG